MSLSVNRRHAIGLGSAGAAMLGLASRGAAAGKAGLSLTALRTQQMVDPIGIDAPVPRLSWQLSGRARGLVQKSYRIHVASSEARLKAGDADLWDSGRVEAAKSFDIRYAGKPLVSRQTAFWQVQVWSAGGETATSEIARWEMGLLSPSDWRAQWLACETAIQRENREAGLHWVEDDGGQDGTPAAFHMSFALPRAAALTLFVAASKPCSATMDGAPLALPPRSPVAWGPPPVARIARQAKAGRHVITLHAAAEEPGGRPRPTRCAVTIRADFADGTHLYITTPDARTQRSPRSGWEAPAYDASSWPVARASADAPQAWPGAGAFQLRREFHAGDEIASARLYATALGAYEVRINGSKVGDALLAPECTDTRKRVYYRSYDVTAMLSKGANAIGAIVGDGWHGSYASPAGRYPFGPPPLRFLGQLEIVYASGKREVIASDDAWQLSHAPITMAEIYDGEDYDARLEQPGWDRPGFAQGADWTPARRGDDPGIAICAMESPPIRVTQTLTAQSIKEVRPGIFVFDFGQNFAGLPRLSVRGAKGQTVTMRFAEVLKPSGEIDQSNLRAARATDTYILRGDAQGEVYTPRFTYHGFRWVELSGFPGRPTADSLQALVIHSDLMETALLDIDNHIVQSLWHNTLWSQRSNFVGLPTDCPQRDERLGWMGDANVFWDAASFNMNVMPFTRRFMRDVRDAQAPNGAFANFSPQGGDPDHAHAQSAPGWADAGVILPWTSFKRLGDTAVIDENWDAMETYIAMIVRENPNCLWQKDRGADFGDWLALDAKRPGDPTTPKDLVGTATFKHSVDAMQEMAAATGRHEAQTRYARLSGDIAKAFAASFVRADGTIGNGSQTGYILALNYDLVPAALRTAALAHLVADIRRRGTLLSTGFLGTPGSLDCLTSGGEDALVYDLLLRTAYPSWGYMVAKGASTIWERWNGDTGDVAMNSFNHYALGAVTGFVFRRIAGLAPLDPGFRRFVFDPVFDGRVTACSARYDSVIGRISAAWKRSPDGFALDLDVPANGEAIVYLPASRGDRILESGTSLKAGPGLAIGTPSAAKTEIRVGSGQYRFRVLAGQARSTGA